MPHVLNLSTYKIIKRTMIRMNTLSKKLNTGNQISIQFIWDHYQNKNQLNFRLFDTHHQPLQNLNIHDD